jgi:hypothetical protein
VLHSVYDAADSRLKGGTYVLSVLDGEPTISSCPDPRLRLSLLA